MRAEGHRRRYRQLIVDGLITLRLHQNVCRQKTRIARDFRELGFSEEDFARWRGMTERPNGIVLVTGPTGSGKTSTLYSTLKQLATTTTTEKVLVPADVGQLSPIFLSEILGLAIEG